MDEIINMLVVEHKAPGVRWKIFQNAWRHDSVFVAEDIPIQPYRGVTGLMGELLYPAVPQGRSIPEGLPHDVAERLVERLNA